MDSKSTLSRSGGWLGLAVALVVATLVVPEVACCTARALPVSCGTTAPAPDLEGRLAFLEATSGSSVGLAALHVESGNRVCRNADDRFPMASVYKLPIAIHVVSLAAAGKLDLDSPRTLTAADVSPGPSLLAQAVARGPVSVTPRRLVELSLRHSDNTASDLLLALGGGPAAVQRRLEQLGVEGMDVERSMREMAAERGGARHSLPGAERLRNGATPWSAAVLLVRLQAGHLGLGAEARRLLLDPLYETSLGTARIPALLPPGTPVAHKTGTASGVVNDIGLVTLPDGSHLALAVFVRGSNGGIDRQERAIAEIAQILYNRFADWPHC